MGKTMGEHFKFAIAYWHSFVDREQIHLALNTKFPWDQSNDPMQRARDKADAAFELITKLGLIISASMMLI